jgi:transcriptional regulator of acetoin/glycerol metabolism
MLQQPAEPAAPPPPPPATWPWPQPWWPAPPSWPVAPRPPSGIKTVEETERELLVAALTEHRGRIPEVARTLGVSRGTVYNKMRKFNLDPDAFR